MSKIKIEDLNPTTTPATPETPSTTREETDAQKAPVRTRIKAGRPVFGVRG